MSTSLTAHHTSSHKIKTNLTFLFFFRAHRQALDSDPYYRQITPPSIFWRRAYDKWLAEHFKNCEDFTREYLRTTATHVRAAARGLPAGLDQGPARFAAERARNEAIAWVNYHEDHPAGKLTNAKILFQTGYPRARATQETATSAAR